MDSNSVASFAWAASAERWRGSTGFLRCFSSPAPSSAPRNSRKPCFTTVSGALVGRHDVGHVAHRAGGYHDGMAPAPALYRGILKFISRDRFTRGPVTA